MNDLRGNITIDASALIEYMRGTDKGKLLSEYFRTLTEGERVSTSLLAVAETFYVLCRHRGGRFAEEKLAKFLGSEAIEICNSTELALEAGRIKCERAISLADCASIASAKIANAKAVFASREAELTREMRRKTFEVEIIFLEDLVA